MLCNADDVVTIREGIFLSFLLLLFYIALNEKTIGFVPIVCKAKLHISKLKFFFTSTFMKQLTEMFDSHHLFILFKKRKKKKKSITCMMIMRNH